jgi:TetR/AcrR family transcriptional repressor of nem operon
MDRTSVADVMREAGLTHGGFYAHFRSKDELAVAALEAAIQQTREWLGRGSEADRAVGGSGRLAAIADSYLGLVHYKHPERGCPLAALGSELARADDAGRKALAEAIAAYIGWLVERAPATARIERLQQATGVLAAMIGGIIMARGAADEDEAKAILADVRHFIRQALESGH